MAILKSINMRKIFQFDLSRVGQDFFTERSHSMLFLEEGKIEALRERRKLGISKVKIVTKEGDVPASFGWEDSPKDGEYPKSWFVLIDRDEKLDYLWVLIKNQVEELLVRKDLRARALPPDFQAGVAEYLDSDRSQMAAAFAKKSLEYSPRFSEDEALASFIDSESQFKIPTDSITGFPHVNFIRWFRDKICSPELVICGGNDYDFRIEEISEPNWRFDIGSMVPSDESSIALDRDDHWLIWLKRPGVKIRISKLGDSSIARSSIPECIDMRLSRIKSSPGTREYTNVDPWDIADFVDQTGAVEVNILDVDPQDWVDFWLMLDRLYDRARVKIKTRHPDQIPEWKLGLLSEIEYQANSSLELKKTLNKILGPERDRTSSNEIISNFKNPWYTKLLVKFEIGRTSVEEAIKICSICSRNDIEVFISGCEKDERSSEILTKHKEYLEKIRSAFTRKHSGTWIGPKIRMSLYLGALWHDQESDFEDAADGAFSFFVDLVDMKFSKTDREDCKKFDISNSKIFYGRWRPDVGKVLEIYNSWSSPNSSNPG